jgi:hypothetical protein
MNSQSIVLHIFSKLTPIFFEVDQYIIKQGRESTGVHFLIVGTGCAFKMEKVKFTHPVVHFLQFSKLNFPSFLSALHWRCCCFINYLSVELQFVLFFYIFSVRHY